MNYADFLMKCFVHTGKSIIFAAYDDKGGLMKPLFCTLNIYR